jgi:predicted ATPase/DNA-binding SARP family transcriptional activator/Tfp pilus assembly protein PilF
VEFRILGSIEAVDNGLTLDLGGLRERTLLARLLLSANRMVPADRLADDLWDGDPPAQSMATLRVYVSRLRRALGPQAALLTQAPGYRLNVDDDQLDAARFERLVRAAESDMAAGRAGAPPATLREALGLWRGPALSDVADLAFAQADAGRLEEARQVALENRIDADLACGRHASLAAELEGLAASYPLRERLTGQRILALYRSGRQAEALGAYADLRARLAEELGIDPNPDLQRLQEKILRQHPGLDWHPPRTAQAPDGAYPARTGQAPGGAGAPARPAGLPTETTSFVGREAELETIDELLRLSRLLTLTGPGGSGKSRLALRSGALASGRYPGGVWLVQLAPISRPDLVVPAAAQALSAREEPGRTPLGSVIARLRDTDALLIVDNCEHVMDAAADMISELLRGCSRLRILATSQTRLGVPGEASWPVPPLTVPGPEAADPGTAAEAESVRLFCDRAALARPGFGLTAGNVAAVSDICRQLDGIPLAIELAAARVSALTVAQLSARLSDRFRLLTGGSRAALPRHRTLEAAIEWSHDLLGEAEQVCFRRMAVFSGGCTIDAAEAVCPDHALPPETVFETVTALIDRSLLTTQELSGSMRYGMLESIHQYALGRLAPSGEAAELRARHLAWLLDLAAKADLAGPDQAAWLDTLEAERDNFRAGLEWSLAPPARNPARDPALALRLAGALAPFWLVRGPITLGRRALDAALTAAGPQADKRLRAIALDGAGQLASVQADHDAQRAYQQESLAIWRELGDDVRVASCLSDLGAVAHIRGEYSAAQALHAEALELAERAGDAQQTGQALSGLGRLALHQGDLDKATRYYTQSMARFHDIGDLRRATLILGNLGVVAISTGDLALAEQRLTEHLENARRLGDSKLTAGALTNLGLVAYRAGDPDRAADLHQQALELITQLGDRRLEVVALGNLGLVAALRRDYAAAARFHLRSLDLAEAVGERRSIAEILEELATVESAAGSPEHAAALFGASEAIREDIGAPVLGPDLPRLGDARAAAEAALGVAAFTAAHQAGRRMSAEEAVRMARQGPWPAPAEPESGQLPRTA